MLVVLDSYQNIQNAALRNLVSVDERWKGGGGVLEL
jgi:hypothetical protein